MTHDASQHTNPDLLADDELIVRYLADELSAEERADLEARLEQEPDLLASFDELAGLTDALPAALGQTEAAEQPALQPLQREQILRAASEASHLAPAAAPVGHSWLRSAPLLGAAAVLLFVLVNRSFTGEDEHAADASPRDRFVVLHADQGDEIPFGKTEQRPAAGPSRSERVIRMPVVKDEEIANLPETDNDMEFNERFGETEGLANAPFEGPRAKGAVGVPSVVNLDEVTNGLEYNPARQASSSADPYVGPSTNGTIGLAGGAGGRFRGPAGGVRPGVRIPRVNRLALKSELARVVPRSQGSTSGESYDEPGVNPFRETQKAHTSTFSIDVDTASYANVRRMLMRQNTLPPAAAVRVEEFVNYFRYDYAAPAADGEHPFATHATVTACPWNPNHRLARVAIQGRKDHLAGQRARNLVFLIDVSGSMRSSQKLPLLKSSLHLLSDRLTEQDRVAIVTYAGNAGIALEPTAMDEAGRQTLRRVIDQLTAGGSTNGADGIKTAYALAARHFAKEGVNRVLLCTDGDFNVGVTGKDELYGLLKQHADEGIFLSVLGFGSGNYQDSRMEDLSNRGNGNYAYIDSMLEARKALVEELDGTLVTIAKDVKIQVFFNPEQVRAWRLVGYMNRRLAAKDFNDDTKDAGEIGAGHQVTAFYELVPVGVESSAIASVDPNPFIEKKETETAAPDPDRKGLGGIAEASFRLRLRYKQPDGKKSQLIESDVVDGGATFESGDTDLHFATAVAAFAMRLRNESAVAGIGCDSILEWARPALGDDKGGYRKEFLTLVEKARQLGR